MTIQILDTKITTDDIGQDTARHSEIIITNDLTSFLWRVGGLPLEGDLQTILDARETELLAAAVLGDKVLSVEEIRRKLYRKSWSIDEFEEAIFEKAAGDSKKFDALASKRETIRADHPI